jgi:hypothetical protein
MTTRDEQDRYEWSRPENCHGGWLDAYVAPRDRRVWAPKLGQR